MVQRASGLTLEIAFSSDRLREVIGDATKAKALLGDEASVLMRAIVSDFRVALFLGEVPSTPIVQQIGDTIRLLWKLKETCYLVVSPMHTATISKEGSPSRYQQAYRIKILGFQIRGELIA